MTARGIPAGEQTAPEPPVSLCQPWGGSGAEGRWEQCNTYRLTCLWAESRRLQNAPNPTRPNPTCLGICWGGGGQAGLPKLPLTDGVSHHQELRWRLCSFPEQPGERTVPAAVSPDLTARSFRAPSSFGGFVRQPCCVRSAGAGGDVPHGGLEEPSRGESPSHPHSPVSVLGSGA